MVIPILITIIVGTLVVGYYLFVFNELEDIATRASRYAAINAPAPSALETYVAGELSSVNLTSKTYSVVSAVQSIGGIDFVVVTITYNFSFISQTLSNFLGLGDAAMSYAAVSRSPMMQ